MKIYEFGDTRKPSIMLFSGNLLLLEDQFWTCTGEAAGALLYIGSQL